MDKYSALKIQITYSIKMEDTLFNKNYSQLVPNLHVQDREKQYLQ